MVGYALGEIMRVPFFDLKKQYAGIKQEIEKAVFDILEKNAFILGESVNEFEKEFASHCNAKYAVGTNNGTAALHLALLASNIGKGDEVITTPQTFIATAESISHCGATPVFADIDEKTYCISPEEIEKKISKKTKAILPVHLYGQPADMQPIKEIAEKHGLAIIEDCCQAHGSEYNKKKVPVSGSGCFSFYPSKNIGACGEAGIIVGNNEEIMEKARLIRAHGENPKNFHSIIGYNYRMEGIQGAVLRVKLRHLDNWNAARRKNAKIYNELLSGTSIVLPFEADYAKHVYHLYCIQTSKRDALKEFLEKNGIGTGIHYPTPLHLQQAYSFLGNKKGSFPKAEKTMQQLLSLPMFPELTEEQVLFVCSKIKEFLKE